MRTLPSASSLCRGALFAILLSTALVSLSCGDGTSPPTEPGKPTVTLTSPTAGSTVTGAVQLAATARNCDRVRFLVDGTAVDTDESIPYAVNWNSGTATNGTHTVTARGEGAGESAVDSVTFTVENTSDTVVITISPASATIALGSTLQFAATVTGTANPTVDWSVEGSATHGTISATGLYTAPLALPTPAGATVVAVSRADPSKRASAVITLTGSSGAVTEAEKTLALDLFDIAHQGTLVGTNAVALAAEAVWGASELAGAATTTGTLTQSAPGSDLWTYASTPTDRLVVAYAGGPRFEFTFARLAGKIDGTWEEFVDAHDLDLTVRGDQDLDAHVVSERHYVDGAEVPYTWKSVWTRRVTGTVPYQGSPVSLDITHTGEQQGYNEPGYLGLENEERMLGSASRSGAPVTLDEYYWSSYLHNSNVGHIVRNWQMTVNSGATVGGVAYAYEMAGARWEASSLINDPGAINRVREPDYWRVSGRLTRDGATLGTVDLDGPVLADTNGPNLILRLVDEGTLILHTLVPGPGE